MIALVRRGVASLVAASLATIGARASADGSTKAQALALYDQAKQLEAKGDWTSACEKLEASVVLDATMNSLYRLGECDEHVGKPASAWRRYLRAADAAAAAKESAKATAARTRASALEPKLPRLEIDVSEPASTTITLDGVAVTADALGVAAPIDPGTHEVRASAAGKKTYATKVEIGATATTTKVSIAPLEPPPSTATTSTTPTTPTKTTTTTMASASPSPTPAAPEGPSSTARGDKASPLGPILLVGGGVVVLVGGGLALAARSKYHDADARCVGGCDDVGLSQTNDARALGNVATIVLGVGVAAAATGAVLWLTSPSSESKPSSIAVGVGGPGLVVKGAF